MVQKCLNCGKILQSKRKGKAKVFCGNFCQQKKRREQERKLGMSRTKAISYPIIEKLRLIVSVSLNSRVYWFISNGKKILVNGK